MFPFYKSPKTSPLSDKINKAKSILLSLSKNHRFPILPCIIFDIDGTLLDWNKNPIIPVVELYLLSGQLNLKRFIITARTGTNEVIRDTIDELAKIGVTNYDALFFRQDLIDDPETMKRSARKKIRDLGYNCVMSVGDTYWDVGEYGGIGVLV